MGAPVVEVAVLAKLLNDHCNKLEREIQEAVHCCGWLTGGWRMRLKVRGCRNTLDMECYRHVPQKPPKLNTHAAMAEVG